MNSNVRHDFQAFGGQVSQDGLLGFTFGSGTQRKMQDGTETTTPILYVAAWRLIQWEWRIEAYMWNTARVPAGPVPPAFPLLSADWKAQARSAGRRENSTEVALADTTFANLSANSGYTAAFSRYIAPEAVQATGRIYWGRAEVLPLFEGWGPLESILWTPFQSRSTWSGDVGFSVGNASYTLRRNDGTIEFQSLSKYLTIWARQANGEWLYVIDGGNSRPATPLSTP
jgi:ketosteroid isomerase-like protein